MRWLSVTGHPEHQVQPPEENLLKERWGRRLWMSPTQPIGSSIPSAEVHRYSSDRDTTRGVPVIDFGDAPVQSTAATVLAVVLAVAAATKLRSPRQTADDFASLGLLHPELLARAVPVVELAVALGLVVVRPWGGVAATALMVAFTTVIARVLRNPEQFDAASCACFGGISHAPLSWRSLARNGMLLGLALVASI